MDQTDILHTARLMIEEYGVGAESQAALRADKAFLEGAVEIEENWKRVIAAIRTLRSKDSAP
jgi:hypothetical protein